MRINSSVFDAWLASACMPSKLTMHLLDLSGNASACYDAFMNKDKKLIDSIPPRFRSILENNSSDAFLLKMNEMMDRNSIGVLHYYDPDFPVSLKEIDQSPAILFFQGNVNCLKNQKLAMVGSRTASYTGQKAAKKIATDLSRQKVSIISGLAYGIDAASHGGCIEGGSPTIAVTACGLDIVYPREHIGLRNKIIEQNGLIITEYAPGERPAGWHFPYRNRIIVGLSRALILIEAKIRSGSMTSVQHALEQGKDVFVYPGQPDSEYFEGNHQLLREGGIYFTSAEDILHDLQWLDNQSAVRQNSDCSVPEIAVTREQAAVLTALKPGSLGFDQLLQKTKLDPPVLLSTLTIMQISGLIEPLPGKQYQLKH